MKTDRRRGVIRWHLGLIVCVGLIGWTAAARAESPATTTSRRPNIVLIMADDMGYECVTANGGQSYHTPHLDHLAAQGMRFDECWSQPLCTPSRVQIMTGIYNARNYIRFGLLDTKATTFANILRSAGYRTAITGKWQLGTDPGLPDHFGFDRFCLWHYSRRGNRYANPGLDTDGQYTQYTHGEYGPDIVNRYAVDFITKNKDRPFFLYYPMMLTHWPFDPTPDSPDWDPTFRRNDKLEKGADKKSQKHFADMVAYADKMVGNVLDTLDKLGLADNTLVIFTGDNGTMRGIHSKLNGHDYIGGKGLTTSNGDHVPLIIRWPGHIQPGGVTEELVDFTDVLPTLAEVGGATVPASLNVDGRSLIPLLTGQPHTPRPWTYTWYLRIGAQAKNAAEYAHDGRYKLYRGGQIYDIRADPKEKKLLSKDDVPAKAYQMLHDVIEHYHRH